MFTLDRLSQSMRYIEWAQRHHRYRRRAGLARLQVLTHEQTLARGECSRTDAARERALASDRALAMERTLALRRTLAWSGRRRRADGECDVAPVETCRNYD
ncbi:hypothetical protein EVAR_90842_1 [Eumeta japonica]|uniref:Uncharacterized protein n=1 Tax=Eumeta variegata TaxID=151549 RepID=A0A4C1ZTC2_EUMVA|nr:hypothetical protein EVAR_90842_1 [Eumeta japonica]